MKIVVLMGGTSSEREVSLASGQGVARALRSRGHQVTVLDTRDGVVPIREEGEPIASGDSRPGAAGPRAGGALLAWIAGEEARATDVVFIALHGGAGEDGTVQALLDAVGLPYTGSDMLASAVAMHKGVSKRLFREGGVVTPAWIGLDAGAPLADLRQRVLTGAQELGGWPLVVKPATEGSTVGVTIVRGEDEVAGALEEAASLSSEVIVETYVPGRELAVGVLGDQALPVIEIEPEGGFYDYASKYTKGKSRYTVPARLPEATTARASEQAIRAFQVLGGRGFGRVDFRLREDGGLFCLELNTIPGLTETSLLPKAAGAAGIGFPDLVERIVALAVRPEGAGHAPRGPAAAPSA